MASSNASEAFPEKMFVRELPVAAPVSSPDEVMNVKNALPYHPRHLVHMVDTLPAGAMWSVIGVGPAQLPATSMGIVMGGNCRVGLEDNLYYGYKDLATNRRLVERVVRIAGELQREVATPDDTRAILKIMNS